jgi:pilus assembly protein TadC
MMLRSVIIGLSVVLGVVLLARGELLIGGLITVLAVVRAGMVLGRLRRRRDFANRPVRRRRPGGDWRR